MNSETTEMVVQGMKPTESSLRRFVRLRSAHPAAIAMNRQATAPAAGRTTSG